MEAIFLYFGKVILCSGVMFLYYQLSLKDKTFHHYNRFYLLSAMLISLLLPLIKVEDFTIEVNNDLYLLIDKIQQFNTAKNIGNDHIYFRILFSALGLASLYFVGKLLYGVFRIQQLKSQFQKESFDGINFYHTNLTEAPFSYFKNLFWKDTIVLNSEIGKQILKHEMVHIEQKHSFDKIFIEVITAVFWFNPFFHLIKREINLIHEYLADKKAVKQSDTKAFAQMLLASHFSGTQLPATSPFLSSNLKKRLKMLQKPNTKFGYARRIFALPVLFSVAFAYMVNAENKEIKETNIAIKQAVSQIKKDTVRLEKTQQKENTDPIPELPKLKTRSAEIQKELDKKEKELSQLKPESAAFSKKIEEITLLASEMGKVGGEISKSVDNYFKSTEWKNKMKEIDNIKISELDVDLPENPPASPGVPKPPKVLYLKNNNTLEYSNLSAKEKEEVRQAMKEARKAIKDGAKARLEGERARKEGEKARIAGEKVRIEGEQARKEGEKARLEHVSIAVDGNKKIIYLSNNAKYISTNPITNFNADFIKKDSDGTLTMNGVKNFKIDEKANIKIYIDGKEATKQDMETLSPNEIASMTVNKNSNSDGTTTGKIRIETKK